MSCRAIWESTRAGQVAEGVRAVHGPELLLQFSQEEMR